MITMITTTAARPPGNESQPLRYLRRWRGPATSGRTWRGTPLGGVQASIFARQHSTEGVVWTLEDVNPLGPGDYLLFRDSDDDGTIDSWGVYSGANYDSVYGSTTSWTAWFMDD
jgi:hypothetical protein